MAAWVAALVDGLTVMEALRQRNGAQGRRTAMPGDPLRKEERMGVIKGWEWSAGAGRALQDGQAALQVC